MPTKGLDRYGRPYWRAWAQHEGRTVHRYRRGHLPEIRQWLAALEPGEVQPEAVEAVSELRTVGQLLRAWIAWAEAGHRATTTTTTRWSYLATVERSALWSVSVDVVTVLHLERYAQERRAAGLAWSTIRQHVDWIGGCWTWGQRRALLPVRPLYLPDLPRDAEPRRQRTTPTPEQVAAVVAWIEREQRSPWQAAVVRLAYALGARVSEVVGLRWSAVDLAAGTVRLRGKGRTRTVPIPPAARRVLEDLRLYPPPSPQPRVGVDLERVIGLALLTSTGVRHAIAHACEALEIPHWSPHGLRRHRADQIWESGADPGVVMAALGHTASRSLQDYRRASSDSIARALGDGELPLIPAPGEE